MTIITLQNDQSGLLSFLLRYKIHLHIFIKAKMAKADWHRVAVKCFVTEEWFGLVYLEQFLREFRTKTL